MPLSDTHQLSESQTRALLINPQLVVAEWKLSDRTQVRFEIPVPGYDPAPWQGITDYCLYLPSGKVLAVVEAKRTSRNPREGEEQLRQYVTEIARSQDFAPFGFMSNGLNTFFWEVGLAHPRLVAGFFTPADLERLLFIRQNRQPLAGAPINNAIVDRPYQHEARVRDRVRGKRGVQAQSADAARAAREKAEAELAELQSRIAPLEKEINQLTRQFWVSKKQVVAEKYDLSASRYRKVGQEDVFYEKPAVTLERMRQLEAAAENDVTELAKMLAETSART